MSAVDGFVRACDDTYVPGAYVQWRARAIGEKGTAAEAKLEKAGPFEGMTVRRAMAVVLGVLKETLEDEFSIDRLEMACMDMRTCDTGGDGNGGGSTGAGGRSVSGAAGEHRNSSDGKRDGAAAAVVVGSSGGWEGSPTSKGAAGAAQEGDGDAGNGVDSDSVRSSGGSDGSGGGGVLEARRRSSGDGSSLSGADPSSSSDSFVPRYGYFRRVSKKEMEELLADGAAGGDSTAGAIGDHPTG